MSWAKFDDRYDDGKKVRRAWRRNRAAVGLHAMAITYCARNQTDGFVDIDWLEDKLPNAKERTAVIETLLEVGLFEEANADHYVVHDYLDYNESREEGEARRRGLSAVKSAAGRKGAAKRWGQARDGKADTTAIADANDAVMADAIDRNSSRPDPTYSYPQTPGFDDWLTHHQQVTNHEPPGRKTKAFAAIASAFSARIEEGYTLDQLKLATLGAHADTYRRENGYDTADSVLRPTKVASLIAKGKLRHAATDSQRGTSSAALVAALNQPRPAA